MLHIHSVIYHWRLEITASFNDALKTWPCSASWKQIRESSIPTSQIFGSSYCYLPFRSPRLVRLGKMKSFLHWEYYVQFFQQPQFLHPRIKWKTLELLRLFIDTYTVMIMHLLHFTNVVLPSTAFRSNRICGVRSGVSFQIPTWYFYY